MKVAFTCNRLGIGGAERVICNFANRMISEKHKVQIICLDKLKGFNYFTDKKVKITQLDKVYESRKGFFDRKFAGIINLIKLYLTLKKERPDVVISFYTRQNCYTILVCKLLRIPVIAAERDHFFTSDSKLNHILRRVFYPLANGFIHQTEWARTYLRKHYKIKCEDITLPNPVWIKNYPLRKPILKNVISVGRLEEQKNYKGMFRAFQLVSKEIPETKLNIYGEGIQRKELQNLIEDLGLEKNIIMHGATNNILECYSQADIFVLFSHGEGYPNALMEALASGVPSIASDCPIGGPKDMIIDGKNGILVSVGNENELASEIIKLLKDEELKALLSKNAIKIRETNDFEKIYEKFINYLYQIQKR